jgi:hypothetical protein
MLDIRSEHAQPPHETGSDTDTERDLEYIVAEDAGDKANVIIHNKRVTNTRPGYCLLGVATVGKTS